MFQKQPGFSGHYWHAVFKLLDSRNAGRSELKNWHRDTSYNSKHESGGAKLIALIFNSAWTSSSCLTRSMWNSLDLKISSNLLHIILKPDPVGQRWQLVVFKLLDSRNAGRSELKNWHRDTSYNSKHESGGAKLIALIFNSAWTSSSCLTRSMWNSLYLKISSNLLHVILKPDPVGQSWFTASSRWCSHFYFWKFRIKTEKRYIQQCIWKWSVWKENFWNRLMNAGGDLEGGSPHFWNPKYCSNKHLHT